MVFSQNNCASQKRLFSAIKRNLLVSDEKHNRRTANYQFAGKPAFNLFRQTFVPRPIERMISISSFASLGMSPGSPILDTRPPLVAGQPEARQYRLLCVKKNRANGDFFDIFSVVTQP